MSRIDDVNELYKKSSDLNRLEMYLFIINAIASLFTLINCNTLRSSMIIVQIVVALLFFIVNIVDDGCFWYNAEKHRRKNNVQVGLGTRISEYETDGYYNNDLPESIEKLGLNTLESNFLVSQLQN